MITLYDKDELGLKDEADEGSILREPSSTAGIGLAPDEAPRPSGGGSGGASSPADEMSFGRALIEGLKPMVAARSSQRQQQLADAETTKVKNQQMTIAINALKEGLDMSAGLEGEQRTTFLDGYKSRLDKFEPGLGDAFANLTANPDTAGAISEWAQDSETLKRAIQAGGIKGAKKLLTSPEALKTIQAEIDTKRMPLILRKGQTFLAGWQQLVPPEMAANIMKDERVSASELIAANEWIKANKPDVAKTLAITDRELEVVGRNSEAFYHSLGIVSPKDEGAILVDKAKGENKGKPAPARNQKMTVNGVIVDQPQEWDGTKWVNKGEATPHFKPGDDTGEVVKVELKLSDDYRADTKKFAERRPLFDAATDYFAKRGQKPENKTSAGDAALMFAYAKMRDPNDRLAVSETRDLVKLGNIFERIGVSVQGILEKGETLPDRVAKEMYAEIRRSFTEQNRQQLKVEADYRKKTKDYKGNPDRVVRSYAIPEGDLNPFDAEGKGYDDATAKASGMTPASSGPNRGHMGSVAPVSAQDRQKYGLPGEAYVMLKGRSHDTWQLGVKGEEERGFKVVKLGNRYYSVPKDWSPQRRASDNEPSQADLEFTATKHGITVEEVKRRLKAGKK